MSLEVTGVADLPFIQVFLETIKDILYTGIELQLDMVMQNKSVIQLQIEIEEIGSILHTVFLDISESSFRSIYRCIVRNDHLTGVDTRQREIKVLQRR